MAERAREEVDEAKEEFRYPPWRQRQPLVASAGSGGTRWCGYLSREVFSRRRSSSDPIPVTPPLPPAPPKPPSSAARVCRTLTVVGKRQALRAEG
jgi:hypothetical protein